MLRPNLTKHDILLSLIKAFEHVGKPYDYNFDFDTRDSLVCSELIYDAYFEKKPEKNGIHFETSIVSGRKMVSPLDMAKKYVSENDNNDAELSFVYFLKSDEKKQVASVSTKNEFIKSTQWSKFSFWQ